MDIKAKLTQQATAVADGKQFLFVVMSGGDLPLIGIARADGNAYVLTDVNGNALQPPSYDEAGKVTAELNRDLALSDDEKNAIYTACNFNRPN